MRGWWQDLTDLVLPTECGGCGRPRTALCAECRAALGGAVARRVRPDPAPPGLPAVFAAVPYDDVGRSVLLSHKERGALGLAQPLGLALAGAVCAVLRGETRLPGDTGARSGVGGTQDGPQGRVMPVSLVPVPSSRAAVRARGHDPVRRIAFAAAGELRRAGVPARVLVVLRQRRAVADQSGLDSRQRQANLAGALEVTAGGGRLLGGGGRFVVVDDLMTTGASLAEAARALRALRMEGNTGAEAVRDPVTGVVRRPVLGCVNAIGAAVVAAPPDSFEINRN
ncbi:ComF family protein [Streptomyces sp. Je 1-369]|uniref:ComF family protein n=1 Tax=Streptomyces sp. Je 1-369 TaxID=2966192 RepID=UPI002285682F|nr:ComF family protein [Streptomyces sp. Je 1-369]WAL95854.1 ComF family protein [Streptomyces sp. Je 1-369]